MYFKFDFEKAINAVLYITKSIKNPDFHKIFKILYFAEQKHISRYGRLIVGDQYYAMNNGPVPSRIYDIFKCIKGDSFYPDQDNLSKYFEIKDEFYIHPKADVNVEVFSETDIECLNESIEENKNLTFDQIKRKSHKDEAYKNANQLNDKISFYNMAKAGGAPESMLVYIKAIDENNLVFS
jgi:uncharacterized phage-associated protein